MVSLGKEIDIEKAKEIVINNLNNNLAYEKFKEIVNYQKGNLTKLEISKKEELKPLIYEVIK